MSYSLFGDDPFEQIITPSNPPPVSSPPPTTTTPPAPQPFVNPFSVGSVEALPYGTQPYVELVDGSTSNNYIINFGVVEGPAGTNGIDGITQDLTEINDRLDGHDGVLAGHTAGIVSLNSQITEIEAVLTGVAADVGGLNVAVATISGEVDGLAATVSNLEPRVATLEEKTFAITYDVATTNIASNTIVVGDLICNRLFTSVFDNQPNLGVCWQFG